MAKLNTTIPFVARTITSLASKTPIICSKILTKELEIAPALREARMIAKKGVRTWDEIGKSSILPTEQRIISTNTLIDHFMNGEWLDNFTNVIKERLHGHKKVEIVFTRALEGGSLNLIPPAMAAKIQTHLASTLPDIEVAINKTIFQASKANRTSANNAATLLSRQQIFEGPVTKGTAYVLVDEHIEAGATIRALDNHIRSNGGHVAAISTLTKNPGSEFIHIKQETLDAIIYALSYVKERPVIGHNTRSLSNKTKEPLAALTDTLSPLGLKLETLTNMEGLAIVAHLSSDKQAFDKLLKKAGTNLEEFAKHGGDYIIDMLTLPPQQKTVAMLSSAIREDLGQNYRYMGSVRR